MESICTTIVKRRLFKYKTVQKRLWQHDWTLEKSIWFCRKQNEISRQIIWNQRIKRSNQDRIGIVSARAKSLYYNVIYITKSSILFHINSWFYSKILRILPFIVVNEILYPEDSLKINGQDEKIKVKLNILFAFWRGKFGKRGKFLKGSN